MFHDLKLFKECLRLPVSFHRVQSEAVRHVTAFAGSFLDSAACARIN
jgi:hypothetical protein